MTDPRLDDLAARLAALTARIATACAAAGRDPVELTLVAVSKTWPAADVVRLAALGVRDFGESYAAEARDKAGALRAAGLDVAWHFVGRLQRNKCRSIATFADVVHSVDRPEVVTALSAAAARAEREIAALVQVSYDHDDDPGRGGCRPDQAIELARLVAGAPWLTLRGVMALAPLGAPAGPVFAELRTLAAALRTEHPGATVISAGMSGDLEDAVREGATHLRVGTALFGDRPPASV